MQWLTTVSTSTFEDKMSHCTWGKIDIKFDFKHMTLSCVLYGIDKGLTHHSPVLPPTRKNFSILHGINTENGSFVGPSNCFRDHIGATCPDEQISARVPRNLVPEKICFKYKEVCTYKYLCIFNMSFWITHNVPSRGKSQAGHILWFIPMIKNSQLFVQTTILKSPERNVSFSTRDDGVFIQGMKFHCYHSVSRTL